MKRLMRNQKLKGLRPERSAWVRSFFALYFCVFMLPVYATGHYLPMTNQSVTFSAYSEMTMPSGHEGAVVFASNTMPLEHMPDDVVCDQCDSPLQCETMHFDLPSAQSIICPLLLPQSIQHSLSQYNTPTLALINPPPILDLNIHQ